MRIVAGLAITVIIITLATPFVTFGRIVIFGPPDYAPPAPDPELETRDISLSIEEGEINARLYQKLGITPSAAILWAHGGGFVSGSMNMPEGDSASRAFAHAGLLVMNVDYRLATHRCGAKEWRGAAAVRYPAPIIDLQHAWNRLTEEAAARGIDPRRVYIGGASAGGNLAVHTILWNLRDGLSAPAGVVLAYPLMHHRFPADRPQVGGPIDKLLVKLAVEWGTRCLMGSNDPDRLALAYPKVEKNKSFPATIIVTGDTDPLRPSGEAFADELREIGTSVAINAEPGTWHGHLNQPDTDAFDRTIKEFTRWIDKQSQRTQPGDALVNSEL